MTMIDFDNQKPLDRRELAIRQLRNLEHGTPASYVATLLRQIGRPKIAKLADRTRNTITVDHNDAFLVVETHDGLNITLGFSTF